MNYSLCYKFLNIMKKYLIAGFMQEVGAVTGDFEALNKEDAIKQAKDAGFYKIIGVEEL